MALWAFGFSNISDSNPPEGDTKPPGGDNPWSLLISSSIPFHAAVVFVVYMTCHQTELFLWLPGRFLKEIYKLWGKTRLAALDTCLCCLLAWWRRAELTWGRELKTEKKLIFIYFKKVWKKRIWQNSVGFEPNFKRVENISEISKCRTIYQSQFRVCP